MRYALVSCLLLSAVLIGCAGKKEEEPKGTILKSREVDTKNKKGKVVADDFPPPVKRN